MSDLHYKSSVCPDGGEKTNGDGLNLKDSISPQFKDQREARSATPSSLLISRLNEDANETRALASASAPALTSASASASSPTSESASVSVSKKSFKSQSLNKMFRQDSRKESSSPLPLNKPLPSRGVSIFAPKAKSPSPSSSLLSKTLSIPSTHGHMTLVPLKRDPSTSPANLNNQSHSSSAEAAAPVWKKSTSLNKDNNLSENKSITSTRDASENQDSSSKKATAPPPTAVPTPPMSEEELEKSGIKLTHRFQAKDFSAGNFNWDEDDEDWDGSIDFKQMSGDISEQVNQSKLSADVTKPKSSSLSDKPARKTKENDQGISQLPATPWSSAASQQVKIVPIAQQLKEFSEKKSNSSPNSSPRTAYHQPQSQNNYSHHSNYDRYHDNERRHNFWGEENSLHSYRHEPSRRFDHERRTDNFGPPMYESHSHSQRRNDGWSSSPQRGFDRYDNAGPRMRRDSFEDEHNGSWPPRRVVPTFINRARRVSNDSSHSSTSTGRPSSSPTTQQHPQQQEHNIPQVSEAQNKNIPEPINVPNAPTADASLEKEEPIASPKDDIAAILKKQEEIMRISREKARKRKEEELQREKEHQMEVLRKAKEKADKLKHTETVKPETSNVTTSDVSTKVDNIAKPSEVQKKPSVYQLPSRVNEQPVKERTVDNKTDGKENEGRKEENNINKKDFDEDRDINKKDFDSDSINSLQRPVWLRRPNIESQDTASIQKPANQGLWGTVGAPVKESAGISWLPIGSSSGFPPIYSQHNAKSRSTGMINANGHSIEAADGLSSLRGKSQSTSSFAGFLNQKEHGFNVQNSVGSSQNSGFLNKFGSQLVQSDSPRFPEDPWSKNNHLNDISKSELPSVKLSPEETNKTASLRFSRYTLKDSTSANASANTSSVNTNNGISAVTTNSGETKAIASLPSTPGKASKRVFSRFFPSPKVGDADYSHLEKSPNVNNGDNGHDNVLSSTNPYFSDPPRISLPRPALENERYRRDGFTVPNNSSKLPSLNSIQALQDTIAQRLSSKFSVQTHAKVASLDLPTMPLISEIPPDCYESEYPTDSREPRIALKRAYSAPETLTSSTSKNNSASDMLTELAGISGLTVQTKTEERARAWNFSYIPSLKIGNNASHVNNFISQPLPYKLPINEYLGTYDTTDSKGFKHEREFKPILTIRVETLQINVPGGNRVSVSRSTGEIVQSKRGRS